MTLRRRRRRRLRRLVLTTTGFLLTAAAPAFAAYRGSDLLTNVGPVSQAGGGLIDRYPLSAYALDYHVDVGVTNPDGIPPMIAQWAAAQLWNVTSFLVKCVIDLFTWAFSLNLLGGSDGALAPISQAITSLYENVIGQSWMVVAILVAGIWGIWKALVQRRYTETAGALGLSVVFVLIALFFVYQPQQTIGQASNWTNTLSLAFLSGANSGSLDQPDQAKHQVADQLFQTLVYRPWAVLEFGGLSHCVDGKQLDSDGFPKPVGPHDPSRTVCRDHITPSPDGHGGYASRFLRQDPGSDARNAEYEALKSGQAPPDPQFAGYKVDKADAPAVDIQQAGGAFQRLTFAALVFLGALGAVVLLGALSLAVILAQIVALVLLGFAPVALVVGIFPGGGHAFFRGWLTKLATAVFIKAIYSLIIALVVAVSAALAGATGSLGFLFAFGLQTLFFWALFIYRKQITSRLVTATSGGGEHPLTPRMNVVQRGARAAARPVTALVGIGRTSSSEGAQQESALAGGETAAKAQSAAAEPTDSTSSPSAPARPRLVAGYADHGGDGPTPPEPVTSAATPSRPRGSGPAAVDSTPRGAHEDVMQRARAAQARQSEPVTAGRESGG